MSSPDFEKSHDFSQRERASNHRSLSNRLKLIERQMLKDYKRFKGIAPLNI